MGSLLTGGKTTNMIRHDYIEIVYENNHGELKSLSTDLSTKGTSWRAGTYERSSSVKDSRCDLSNLNITIQDLHQIYVTMKDWEY